MKCPNCNSNLVWGGDQDYDDFGEAIGIVSNYSCNDEKCFVDLVVVHQYLEPFDDEHTED